MVFLMGNERVKFLSTKNKDKIFRRNLDVLYLKFTKNNKRYNKVIYGLEYGLYLINILIKQYK